jgi:DNA-binding NarL/FixJ family response regulator
MKEPIRVVLADDHVALREALARHIDAEPDISVVAETGNGFEAIEKVRELDPDILLIDLSMPQCEGVSAIKTLREECPKVRALVLTMHESHAFLTAALAAGAAGYITKRAASSELIQAIREVKKGRSYINVDLAEANLQRVVAANLRPTQEDAPVRLSERERDVLVMVAHGFTSREIAQRMKITRASVDTYRQRVSEKLKLKNRADLVSYAVSAGLLGNSNP